MSAIANGFQQRVADARERFFDGNTVPLELVSGSVVRSWERSRRLGLSMTSRSLFNAVPLNLQRGVEERARDLIGFAMPEMERLLAALSRADWTLACVDRDGIVIAAINTPEAASGLRSAFRTGVELGEDAVGTTAPGCALRERKAITINANEHFLDDLRTYSCIAVPIFAPDGELAGALDASCSYAGNPLTAMEPIFVAARSVENRMVQAIPESVQIAVHYRADMLGTPLEGMLAFSEDGRLLGMNQPAQRMLSLDSRPADLDFAALFDGSFARTLDALRHPGGTPLVLENRAGARLMIGRRERTAASFRDRRGVRPLPAQSGLPAAPPPGSGDAIVERASLLARRALARDIPVLINGETGTGKDVLARHIHEQGPRAAGPFVAVNCSAIPAGLIESELFGYEDGAFTGGRRGGASGRFEQACGGTLFLDEIGDMPLDLQARLLRVLQERSLMRVGGSRPIALDAAVICATHRDLKALVARGAFREDLYYRINGLRITLPPLRERPDRRALIESLLAREAGGRRLAVAADAMDALLGYDWPGNIRQLQHAIRLAVVLAEDEGRVERAHLHEDILDAQAAAAGPGQTDGESAAGPLEQAERDVIRGTLARHAGNVSAAARELGIGRETLYRRLRTLGLAATRRGGPDR